MTVISFATYVLFLFKSLFVVDHDYIEYHNLINKAEILCFESKPDSAFSLYEEALSGFSPFTKDLFNAAVVAAELNKISCSEEYLIKYFERSGGIERVLKHKILSKKIGKKKISNIYNSSHLSFKDNKLRQQIDSMFVLDQKVRNSGSYTSSNVDKNNTEKLLAIIQTQGFPNEIEIGFDMKLDVLLAHSSVFWSESKNIKVLEHAVYSGDMHPYTLAWICDRATLLKSLLSRKEYYLSYNFINEHGKNSRSNVEMDQVINAELVNTINERRAKIGIHSIENGRKLNQKQFMKKYNFMFYQYL